MKAFICYVLSMGKYGLVENYQDNINPDQGKAKDKDIGNNEIEGVNSKSNSQEIKKGSWMVVQKVRRRKLDNTTSNKNTVLRKGMKETRKNKGYCFSAFMEEGEVGTMGF